MTLVADSVKSDQSVMLWQYKTVCALLQACAWAWQVVGTFWFAVADIVIVVLQELSYCRLLCPGLHWRVFLTGTWNFAVAGAKIWNSLPANLRLHAVNRDIRAETETVFV